MKYNLEMYAALANDGYIPGTYFLKINNSTFRCDSCGSNCFQKHYSNDDRREKKFRCNGCGSIYSGE